MEDMTVERWQDPGAPGKLGLKLTGEMTIGQATELKEVLLTALDEADELLVDLSAVSGIDLTGLQLLDASHRSAQARGKLFGISTGGNPVCQEAFGSAGFHRSTGCAADKNGTCIWVGGEC
jgi:anti-anti-sigma regulatory factor